MMPPPMIGPRGTCADNEAAESISTKITARIEFAKLLLLRTAFSFPGRPAETVASYQGIALAMPQRPKLNAPLGAVHHGCGLFAAFSAGALLAAVALASALLCGCTGNPC
jgi:hypothetical protein